MGNLDIDPIIQHFSHQHPLKFINFQPQTTSTVTCAGCEQEVSGWIYSCRACNYCLHKTCSQMPECKGLPIDPKHTLKLLSSPVYPGGVFKCNACGKPGTGFCYRCKECQLDIHTLCAYMPAVVNIKTHNHTLNLCFNPPYQKNRFQCDICKGFGSNHWLYHCGSCNFYAHMNCAMTNSQSQPASGIQQKQPNFQSQPAPGIQQKQPNFQSQPTSGIQQGQYNFQSQSTSGIPKKQPNFQRQPAPGIQQKQPNFQSQPTAGIQQRQHNFQFQSTSGIQQNQPNFQSQPTSGIQQGQHNFQSTSGIQQKQPNFQPQPAPGIQQKQLNFEPQPTSGIQQKPPNFQPQPTSGIQQRQPNFQPQPTSRIQQKHPNFQSQPTLVFQQKQPNFQPQPTLGYQQKQPNFQSQPASGNQLKQQHQQLQQHQLLESQSVRPHIPNPNIVQTVHHLPPPPQQQQIWDPYIQTQNSIPQVGSLNMSPPIVYVPQYFQPPRTNTTGNDIIGFVIKGIMNGVTEQATQVMFDSIDSIDI